LSFPDRTRTRADPIAEAHGGTAAIVDTSPDATVRLRMHAQAASSTDSPAAAVAAGVAWRRW
jgi:hypothetical protein